jgi:hypothetical protein
MIYRQSKGSIEGPQKGYLQKGLENPHQGSFLQAKDLEASPKAQI